ncbi:hypothetical protein MKW94_027829, partial [Papaver nudicaule]|nr:hypothetical protein [Papaver nudicaule]
MSSYTELSSKPAPAPEPPGAWPIIGHLPLLRRGNKPAYVTFGELADKLGPAFIVRIGLSKALVVSSWEVAKECFTTNDEIFASRPSAAGPRHMCYHQTMFGFAPYGGYYRELRKIANHELSTSKLQMVQHMWDSEINTSVKELHELYVSKPEGDGGNGVSVDLRSWFAKLSLNIYVKFAVGTTSGLDPAPSEGIAGLYPKPIAEFFRLMGVSALSDALPFLRGWLDIGGNEKQMKINGKALDAMMEKWLQEHKTRSKSSSEAGEEQDFMDVMMSILLGGNNKIGKLSKPQVDDDTISKSSSL